MTAAVPTTSRIQLVDFTHPILYMPVSFLIPIPVSAVNLLSAAKPFQAWVYRKIIYIVFYNILKINKKFFTKVWLTILIVLFATLISLKLISITSEGKIEKNKLFSSKTILDVVGLLLAKRRNFLFFLNKPFYFK